MAFLQPGHTVFLDVDLVTFLCMGFKPLDASLLGHFYSPDIRIGG